MGFIQNLSFKSKLLLIAIPPLLGIIFYSIIFISSLLSEKSNLEATKNQIQEIEVLSKIGCDFINLCQKPILSTIFKGGED